MTVKHFENVNKVVMKDAQLEMDKVTATKAMKAAKKLDVEGSIMKANAKSQINIMKEKMAKYSNLFHCHRFMLHRLISSKSNSRN
jgi:hypothetical protein